MGWRKHFRIRKRFALALAIGVLGLTLLYYLGGKFSNALTRDACERSTALAIVKELEANESMPTYIYGSSARARHSASTFESVGVSVRPCDDPAGCLPTMIVGEAEPIAPYVMSVEWTVALWPLGANSGIAKCLSIFGFTFCKLRP
jgi:hypothetical protein